MKYKPVILPIEAKQIMQDTAAQAVSDAAALMVSCVLENAPEQRLRLLDVGTGCGIIAIMLALQRVQWSIEAIEIVPELADLAAANAKACDTKVKVITADLCTWQSPIAYDLIVANPPWQKQGEGICSPYPLRNIGRQEICCTMQDLLAMLQRNMKATGKAFVIYPKSRINDMISNIAKTKLDIICSFRVPESEAYLIFLIGFASHEKCNKED